MGALVLDCGNLFFHKYDEEMLTPVCLAGKGHSFKLFTPWAHEVQGRMTSAETVPRNQQFSHLEVGHVESRFGLGFGSGPFLSKLIKIFSRFSAKLFG